MNKKDKYENEKLKIFYNWLTLFGGSTLIIVIIFMYLFTPLKGSSIPLIHFSTNEEIILKSILIGFYIVINIIAGFNYHRKVRVLKKTFYKKNVV
ncbi:hypothetical protein [Breznakiella homolactica]|uniref:Uncharacterized protein n=1 Tax=Breznakiella homolactica TaxID=2798577 RepID=A0A7T7XQ82_9SPIR|nr:hypothetical protein [Breznakiella homolactica]QQO10393.1 hypothetical protein JFL75_05595 [Breznakiella homolactica]